MSADVAFGRACILRGFTANEAHSPQHRKCFLLNIAKLETLHPLGKRRVSSYGVSAPKTCKSAPRDGVLNPHCGNKLNVVHIFQKNMRCCIMVSGKWLCSQLRDCNNGIWFKNFVLLFPKDIRDFYWQGERTKRAGSSRIEIAQLVGG